jgi:hypothetical protein
MLSASIIRLHLVRAHGAAKTASAAGGDLADLGTGRPVALNGTGLTHVLLVTTTVGMVYGVHRYGTDSGPLVSLRSVLVERTAGLEQGLVGAAAAGDEADHGAALVGQGLLAAGGQAHAGHASLLVLGDDDGVVAGSTGHLAAIAGLGLDVADDGTFGDGGQGQDVADGELG